jgi:hypothetical protein
MSGQETGGKRKIFRIGRLPMNKNSRVRLNWKQMEPREGWSVVKGTTHRVIVVKLPDKRYFEEAIFVVRDDVLRERGADSQAILREAHKIASSYIGQYKPKALSDRGMAPRVGSGQKIGVKTVKKLSISRLPAPLIAAAGAAATGLAWLTAHLCGL